MRTRDSAIKIDMFPFLSVLCAVIGVLMLFLLLVISSRIVDDSPQQLPESVESTGDEEQTPLSEETLSLLREQLVGLSAELNTQKEALEELQRQRDVLRELLAIKSEEYDHTYGDGLIQGVELAAEVSVLMKPVDETRVTKQPKFVEVDLSGYVIYPEQKRCSLNDLPDRDHPVTIDHQPTTPMERFLDQADDRRDKEYLVLLIRPSGSDAFDRVRSYLVRRYPHPQSRELSRIDIGWEPFAPEWLLAAKNLDTE